MNNPPSNSSGSKFLFLILLAAVAGLGAWAFILKRDLAEANEELAAAHKSSKGATVAQGEVQRLKAQVGELESRLAAGPVVTPAAAPAEAPAQPAQKANPIAVVAQMMANNPAMRTMMAATQRRGFEAQYAEMFDALQFTPEQRARFLDLLAERQAATTDAGLKLASGNLSADERRALAQEVQQANQNTQAAVRELLGDDSKFAYFRQYTDQQTERTQVGTLRTALASSATPLSADQSSALTNLMYEERKAFTFTRNPDAGAGDPAAALNSQTVETNLQEQEQLNERIATRAAGVLTPEQVAALRQSQATRLQTTRAGLEMSRQMLGVGQPAAK
jgi:polyhydroxyalkanoate synthesis regulator phasin